MRGLRELALGRLMLGVSAAAIAMAAQPALAQDDSAAAAEEGDAIVVTGIRASLRASLDV